MGMYFARNFIKLRKEKGITQEKMAEICGITRSALAKWENGSSIPNMYMVIELAETFDVTVDELLRENMTPISKIGLIDISEQMEIMKKEILIAIQKRGDTDMYQEYSNYIGKEVDGEIPTDVYSDCGYEEEEKGNYDVALKYFEEAAMRGNIDAINSIMTIYQTILDGLEYNDTNAYWTYRLQMAHKMQSCGKILEEEIKSGRVF